ncbi:hypothetical protein GCM10010126_09700 [Planomonospora parontospora]|uniref:Uncharacterized protein n=1 Tax=Planomonospora parontospora TaxID=58119 RepID=A0AA37BCV6_9ACTN|nr:hypothetical protein GCM10010126_09700 [Planomonospora parontospora]
MREADDAGGAVTSPVTASATTAATVAATAAATVLSPLLALLLILIGCPVLRVRAARREPSETFRSIRRNISMGKALRHAHPEACR